MSTMPPLQSRFQTILTSELSARNLRLAPSTRALVDAFITDGVTELQAKAATPPQVAQAENGLGGLIERMAADAAARGVTELDDKAFNVAKLSLCPWWPFC